MPADEPRDFENYVHPLNVVDTLIARKPMTDAPPDRKPDALDELIADLRNPEGVYGYQSQLACRAAAELERLRAENARLKSVAPNVVEGLLRAVDAAMSQRDIFRERAIAAEDRVAELERVPEDAALDEVASKLAELATICRADGQRNAVDACVVARIMFRRLRVHLADALRENAALHDVHDDNLALKAELRQERLIAKARAQDAAAIVAERDAALRFCSVVMRAINEYGITNACHLDWIGEIITQSQILTAIDAARGKP
jgi:hypothetical protein